MALAHSRSYLGVMVFLTAVLVTSILVGTTVMTKPAFAHKDHPTCVTAGHSISLAVFADAALTIPKLVLTQADAGTTIYFVGTLGAGPAASDCAYEGGTVSMIRPNGTIVDVTPVGGVACIDGTAANTIPPGDPTMPCTNRVVSQQTQAAAYVVDFADATPAKTFSAAISHLGKTHFNSGDTLTKSFTEEIEVPIASTVLSKSASANKVSLGSNVTYTYTETNDGGSSLFNPFVTDDGCAPVTFVGGDTNANGVLDPGESWTFTCTTTLNTLGPVTNNATGHGFTLDGRDIAPPEDPDEQASVTVMVVESGLTITKTPSANKVLNGTEVTYSFEVCNTGNVSLENVNVDDSNLGHITGPITLAAGQCEQGTASEVLFANKTNTATATADFQLSTISASTTAFVHVINPDMTLVKTASTNKVLNGTNVTYTYTVTNTGDTTINNINISDDIFGPICTIASVAPGESDSCTHTATITTDTTNTATATGEHQLGTIERTATATVRVFNPDMTLTKTPSENKVVAGTEVTYTYEVCNTGSTTINNIEVTDDVYGGIGTIPSLTSGQCSELTHTAAINADVTNTATATGEHQLGSIVRTAEAFVDVIRPDFTVTKTCEPDTQSEPGTITWTIIVTNTGDVDLDVSISDSTPGHIFPPTPITIPPGGSEEFIFVDSNLDDGTYTDVVTVVASHQLGEITKTAEDTCVVEAGGEVTRTPGYWKTHLAQSSDVWADVVASGNQIQCDGFNVDTTAKLMGGFWSSISRETDGDRRTSTDQARMMLAFQLQAAILNNEAFGSSPDSFGTSLADAKAAFCGDGRASMLSAASDLDEFNNSGDDLPFPDESFNSSATARAAFAAADRAFWNQPNLPGSP